MRYDRTLGVTTAYWNGWIDDPYYLCYLKGETRIIKSIKPASKQGHYILHYHDNQRVIVVATSDVDIYIRNKFPED